LLDRICFWPPAFPLRVIRDRVEPAASPAMSAMPPKAEVNSEVLTEHAMGHSGLMALPET